MDVLLNSEKLAAEEEEHSPRTPGTFINVKRGQVNQDYFGEITISYQEAYGYNCKS